MDYRMTKDERESFLADLHVGVIGISSPKRAPILLPIWYTYEPGGEINFITSKDSKKTQLLATAGRFTLCVQNEDPPYQYVSVEGRITSTEDAGHEKDLRPIAYRYLGKKEGEEYVEETKGVEELLIRMMPEKWSTADYGKEIA
ncbi:MAG: pyridoxamine 5'-phosphate oxidase family protein [Anaerolineales bacterium]|uniref:Pyridoxamine 5'-phosphate oxidase family protein n=1 Tax=Candidatus Desulfolinea nitratireducens TaxID=2841698 RepID=A0A8J6TE35_9CHLR|nr:pyridoxamine 5'-phosphate oxidase family protein [Candidatus Desulfolinea nitratireducens]